MAVGFDLRSGFIYAQNFESQLIVFDVKGLHTPEYAAASKTLAANQGLYNGFLAAGLIWGLAMGAAGLQVKVFFLACVIIAGVFGAVTVSRGILFVQAIPGIIALALVLQA